MKVKLGERYVKECEKFVKQRCGDSELYQKRGGFKPEDIMCGALAEYAVYLVLKDLGYEDITEPDFTILERTKKSYNADLRADKYHFHVKGQTLESVEKYGTSWILQRTDKLITDPPKHHYLVPCKVDIANSIVEILGCVPMHTIVDRGLIGECKLAWFRKTKVAIYWGDIEKALKINQKWSILYK